MAQGKNTNSVMARSNTGAPAESIEGVRLASTACGLKRQTTDTLPLDLLLIEARQGSHVAATFTNNRFAAAPVELARRHLQQHATERPVFLLINSGNANAGTGAAGMAAAERCCSALAAQLAVQAEDVLPFSTGVIGEQLAVEKIEAALPVLQEQLVDAGWKDAGQAIMTTDTVAKTYSQRFELFGREYSLTGIAKGAGMIKPNMATMLAFLATDAPIEQAMLQQLLSQAVERSFNRITVDGDTSTNDACVLLATGDTEKRAINRAAQIEFSQFSDQLDKACLDLAQQIIRDAEGATKLVSISVEQGESESDCLEVAYTVAHSPLVKTALFASDPNWGRILAAVGRAPIASLDVDAVSIYLDDVLIASSGCVAETYREADAQQVMNKPEYTVRILLGAGQAVATVWTCDLSHDYVSINADYRS